MKGKQMDDLISRQAAIKAVGATTWAGFRLEKLPSAQPEIVRCKDCKYQDSFKWCTYKTRLAWETKDDDFCSKGERKDDEQDD